MYSKKYTRNDTLRRFADATLLLSRQDQVSSFHYFRVVTRYMRSGITAPGSGITTLGIGISSVFVESGIKIVNVFGIRDQNSQCFCDQGLKFSTFL